MKKSTKILSLLLALCLCLSIGAFAASDETTLSVNHDAAPSGEMWTIDENG